MFSRGQAEMVGDAGADVGEGFPPSDRLRQDAGSEGEDGNEFASVVRPLERRVAAVVCGGNGEVAGPQHGLELRQTGVEGLERRGIAGNIAPMAMEHVEIDEVGEDEVAVARLEELRKPPDLPCSSGANKKAKGEMETRQRHDYMMRRERSRVAWASLTNETTTPNLDGLLIDFF